VGIELLNMINKVFVLKLKFKLKLKR
jgi:hypothetical protein